MNRCYLAAVLLLATTAFSQIRENAARFVTWQPIDVSAFEDGYKRHLAWHRSASDPWTWYGWTIISGDRYGAFIDATMFHQWPDFDNPVKPAEDAADNAMNVLPYGQIRSVVSYEVMSPLTVFRPQDIESYPLLSFFTLRLRPGAESAFEHAAIGVMRGIGGPHAILRPVTGATDYLLLLPARNSIDLPENAEIFRRLVAAMPQDAVVDTRLELARFRRDMSYWPQS